MKIITIRMKKLNSKIYLELVFVLLLVSINNEAFAGATQTKLQSVYTWLKPSVNIVLTILTLLAAGRAISKTFFKHQEAGMEWLMFMLGCILWGLWITFATEIIQTLGGGTVTF